MAHGLKGSLKSPETPILSETVNQAIIDREKDVCGKN